MSNSNDLGEIGLTYMCGVGNVEILLMYKGNSAGSDTTIYSVPGCKCN